jgi:hypothetical protein
MDLRGQSDMRLLVLYQDYEVALDHPGYLEGFQRLVTEGTLTSHEGIAYRGVSRERGWDTLWDEACTKAGQMEADAVFLQFFHGPYPDPSRGIERLRALPSKPTIFTSLGDPFGRWSNRISNSYRIASAKSDVSFQTGMGYIARQLSRWGSKNLVLMPHGCCQVRLLSIAQGECKEPEFDVIFIGNRFRPRNPFSHFAGVARRRAEFVARFTRRYGRRFGLFGKGWEGNESWQGPVRYAQQNETCRRSAVVLGGMPNGEHDYYLSDRPFIAAASGVPLVDYWVRGVDRILEPERDWWLAHNVEGMIAQCDRLLAMSPSERDSLGRKARETIAARHTEYHRCREMIGIVQSVREARQNGKRADIPRLSFLCVHNPGEMPAAVVGWEG